MAHSKLAQQLMDAYMIGDQEQVNLIKGEIDKRYNESLPKRKENVIKFNTVLNNDNSSASSIYDFLNKAFGPNWWEWEFETIEKMLWLKYGVALEDINRDKVWAIRHVCRSDNAFADWFEFNQAALSFSGCIADFDYLRSPSPGMVISAVKTLMHIRPDRRASFSNDVLKYICVLLKNEGVYIPPPSLAMLIGAEMRKMVSKNMSSEWMNILKRYQKIVNGKAKNIEENVVDIQAKRLVKAEAAALEYGSR